jgi:hypothetical protein
MARSTIYRYQKGLTKPRKSTLEKLREAGLLQAVETPLLIPSNIWSFAQQRNLPFREVEELMNVRLKPVERMTLQELQWVYESLSKVRDLLTWHTNELK